MQLTRTQSLKKRHLRVRKKVQGTADRPRLCVHKTSKHIQVQAVDDLTGRTLASATTNSKEFRGDSGAKACCNIESAKRLGKLAAEKCKAAGIESVVFDRGGYVYHGVVKALAEAAREGGLKF
ncbi:50S ribosomal protein L18 [Candidatus Sumerlaeota bacterium]|nr:50S ribosomal protein L18 [Candidatus Sumerlaeota bacterium]